MVQIITKYIIKKNEFVEKICKFPYSYKLRFVGIKKRRKKTRIYPILSLKILTEDGHTTYSVVLTVKK